jgi:hypothetical protein
MPLDHSKSPGAFKTNVRTLMHDVGKSPHVQSREQALAIAYSTARRAGAKKKAGGGGFTPPIASRFAQRQMFHEGFLHSAVPGRTDKLPISVSGGAYVLPADHLAALGQGNSLAGANIVNKMFKMGPYGSAQTPMHVAAKAPGAHLNLTPRPVASHFQKGGHKHAGMPTDIIAAGGETVIPPEKIIAKFGSLKKGHAALDQWVVDTRDEHAKTLKGLKPPRTN